MDENIGKSDRTLAAMAYILGYAALIGFSDNYVTMIAGDIGLWQFHAMRSLMALLAIVLLIPLLGLDPRPKRLGAVVVRSALQGIAMMIYFGGLAFLPVPLVAAGLFTAPIFVLLISRFAFGQSIGPVRIIAVILGFAGVILVLGPQVFQGASLAAILPVAAGAIYGLANLATRQWCAEETAEALLFGFFVALALLGVIGMGVLALVPLEVPLGRAGFILRGAVWPDLSTLLWVLMQALIACLAVGMSTRAYLMADAGRVSVMEYAALPCSAFWAWFLWDHQLTWVAWIGIALIVLAGAMIVLRARSSKGSCGGDLNGAARTGGAKAVGGVKASV